MYHPISSPRHEKHFSGFELEKLFILVPFSVCVLLFDKTQQCDNIDWGRAEHPSL
jgi:hypothetical protein